MTPAVYGAHGHVFTVETDVEGLDARVQRALATLRRDEAPVGRYLIDHEGGHGRLRLSYRAYGGADGEADEEVGVRFTTDSVLLLLHWHINQRVIDGAAARRTTFHAAAARSPRGNGILLAAPMESGKTTTVTGLLRAGWDFLTDEAAAVDPDGTLWAYPKPLTIDRGSWELFPDLRPPDVEDGGDSWLVPAPTAGAAVTEQAPLRMIVFPSYAVDHATELIPLGASATALELAHSTFQFDRYGARDLACVCGLARRVKAFRLTIGDLAAAVDAITGLDATLENAA